MSRQPITYADGYGDWHALVPVEANDATGAILTARAAIRDELTIRERKIGESEADAMARLSAYVRKTVKRIPRHDEPGYLHYAERSAK